MGDEEAGALVGGTGATDGTGSGGYVLAPQQDPNWSGLSVPAGQVHADPAAMAAVVKRPNAAADEVQRLRAGLVAGTKGKDAVFGLAEWTSARTLAWANGVVRDAVDRYATLMGKAIAETAASVSAASATVTRSDQANQSNTHRIDADLGGGQVQVF